MSDTVTTSSSSPPQPPTRVDSAQNDGQVFSSSSTDSESEVSLTTRHGSGVNPSHDVDETICPEVVTTTGSSPHSNFSQITNIPSAQQDSLLERDDASLTPPEDVLPSQLDRRQHTSTPFMPRTTAQAQAHFVPIDEVPGLKYLKQSTLAPSLPSPHEEMETLEHLLTDVEDFMPLEVTNPFPSEGRTVPLSDYMLLLSHFNRMKSKMFNMLGVETRVRQLEQDIYNDRNYSEQLENRIDSLTSELESANAEILEVQQDFVNLGDTCASDTVRMNRLLQSYDELNNSYQQLKREHSEGEAEYSKLQVAYTKIQQQLAAKTDANGPALLAENKHLHSIISEIKSTNLAQERQLKLLMGTTQPYSNDSATNSAPTAQAANVRARTRLQVKQKVSDLKTTDSSRKMQPPGKRLKFTTEDSGMARPPPSLATITKNIAPPPIPSVTVHSSPTGGNLQTLPNDLLQFSDDDDDEEDGAEEQITSMPTQNEPETDRPLVAPLPFDKPTSDEPTSSNSRASKASLISSMSKIPWPKFEGKTDEDIQQFFKELALIQTTKEFSNEHFLQIFPLLLQGKAKMFYWQLPEETRVSVTDLKKRMFDKFLDRHPMTQLHLMNYKQGADESVEDYSNEIHRRILLAGITDQTHQYHAYLNGLRKEIARDVMMRPSKNLKTLEQRALCAEKAHKMSEAASITAVTQAVQSVLEDHTTEQNKKMAKLSQKLKRPRPLKKVAPFGPSERNMPARPPPTTYAQATARNPEYQKFNKGRFPQNPANSPVRRQPNRTFANERRPQRPMNNMGVERNNRPWCTSCQASHPWRQHIRPKPTNYNQRPQRFQRSQNLN